MTLQDAIARNRAKIRAFYVARGNSVSRCCRECMEAHGTARYPRTVTPDPFELCGICYRPFYAEVKA